MLRLYHDGVSARAIGRALGAARSTIQDNLRRVQASGIAWPLPAELTDDVLEQRLFARPGTQAGLRRRSEPDWGTLARELGVLPARPRRPRDKAKVEAGVRFAQSYILGRLRHQTFFSLAECNTAIASCLDRMNAHVIRRLGGSRRDLFESIERPALRALPAQDYEYAEWRLARVGLDYHVEAAGAAARPVR
jgi:transposase